MKLRKSAVFTAALAASGIALAACGGTPAPAASHAATPVYTPAAAPATTPAALTSGQSAFVASLLKAQSAVGWSNSSPDSVLAKNGQNICDGLAGGGAVNVDGAPAALGLPGTTVEKIAIQAICPQYSDQVPGTVLGHLSGNGQGNSPPFVVPAQVSVTYSYNCSQAGGSGNFIADLQQPGGGDDQSIANALGAGGTVTTTVYPTNAGSDYYISVNSECTWTVTVKAA
jgi:hypothetical protein